MLLNISLLVIILKDKVKPSFDVLEFWDVGIIVSTLKVKKVTNCADYQPRAFSS